MTALSALAELGAQEERVRVRVVRTGLETKGGAEQLTRWRRELAFAVVGCDRPTVDRLRAVLREHLARGHTGPEATLACALWGAELPSPGDDIDALAARVLSERLGSGRDPAAAAEWAEAAALLAGRVSREDAKRLVQCLVGWVNHEVSPATALRMSVAAASLAGHLDQREASVLVEPATSTMVSRLRREEDTEGVRDVAAGVATLAERVEPEVALGLARAIATRPSRVVGGPYEEEAVCAVQKDALIALARRLSPDDVAQLSREVLNNLARMHDAERGVTNWTGFGQCAWAMATLAVRVPPGEASGFASALRAPLNVPPEVDREVGRAVAALALRAVPADDGRTAQGLVRRLSSERNPAVGFRLAGAVALSHRVSLDDARLLAISAPYLVQDDSDGAFRQARSAALSAVFARLSPADADTLAGELTDRVARAASDPTATHRQAVALHALVRGRKRPLGVGIAAGRAARTAIDRIRDTRERDADTLWVALNLPALTGLAEPTEAVRLAREVAALFAAERHPPTRLALAGVFPAVAEHAGPADAGPLAYTVSNLLAAEQDPVTAHVLAAALVDMEGRLGPAEAGGAAGPLALAVTGRLGPGRDLRLLRATALGFAAVAGSLGLSEGTVVLRPHVRAVADRVVVERDKTARGHLVRSLSSLVRPIRDADLLSFLKSYGSVPDIRQVTVLEFGRRAAAGRALGLAAAVGPPAWSVPVEPGFADMWGFVTRTRNRPDLDLTSPPPREWSP